MVRTCHQRLKNCSRGNAPARCGWGKGDWMGWDGMGWDGMGWDGMRESWKETYLLMKCLAQAWTPWLWMPITVSYATSPVKNGSPPPLRHRTQILSASPRRLMHEYGRKIGSPLPVAASSRSPHEVPSLSAVSRQVTVMTWLDSHHRSKCDIDAFATELCSHRRTALTYQSAVEPTVPPVKTPNRPRSIIRRSAYVAAALISLEGDSE